MPGLNQPHYYIYYKADSQIMPVMTHPQNADFQMVSWSFNIIMEWQLDMTTTLIQA